MSRRSLSSYPAAALLDCADEMQAGGCPICYKLRSAACLSQPISVPTRARQDSRLIVRGSTEKGATKRDRFAVRNAAVTQASGISCHRCKRWHRLPVRHGGKHDEHYSQDADAVSRQGLRHAARHGPDAGQGRAVADQRAAREDRRSRQGQDRDDRAHARRRARCSTRSCASRPRRWRSASATSRSPNGFNSIRDDCQAPRRSGRRRQDRHARARHQHLDEDRARRHRRPLRQDPRRSISPSPRRPRTRSSARRRSSTPIATIAAR